jgi:hypothetical protein
LDNFDFSGQPPVDRDRIYVSWSEQWDISRYAVNYLQEKGLRTDQAAVDRVLSAISQCPVEGSLRKADIDYYLDCHVKKDLEVPQPIALKKSR